MSRLVPELDRTGADETVKRGDDFTGEVKQTIGNFLKSLVDDPDEGKKNSDDRPYTDATTLVKHENTTFFNNLETAAFNELRDVLDSNIESGIGQEDILTAIEGFGGGDTATADADSQQSEAAATVVGSVSQVLNQNRFNATSTYGDNFSDNGNIARMPTSLGSYDPEGAAVNLENLKKVGLSLMLRATGEFIDGDPTSPGVSIGSLLPGQAQLGVRVDGRSLYAENVFGAPGRDPSAGPPRSRLRDILAGESIRSYGQLNSANEPFDGFLPLGMTGLAIILVVALRLIATGFVRLIGLIAGKPFGPGAAKLSTDPLAFGQYGKQTSNNPLLPVTLADIGIIELDRDFTACVDEGLNVFFSFDGQDFGRVARSPGFYANMVRVIVQSAARIINDVVEAFRTLGSGNIVAGAQAILGIVDILRTSKVIAFLNIMAVLGDRSYARKDAGIGRAPRGSVVDALPDNATTRVMKSRVRGPDGSTTLAWRNSAPVSTLIMPRDFIRASAKLQRNHTSYLYARQELSQDPELPFSPSDGRYSPDQVAEIEAKLDAEYVPFYFQDLRTNEIISFHAFINSVNESFSPSYGESTPYGRIDPIMTYGSTRREFSLTFHVVSTSPRDYDLMYMKLNKLVTLLYPQFTRGRTVVDSEGQSFTQPFSQVPGASPLCRIRLGNLIKTNFSNIALGRLFGLGSDDFIDAKPQEVSVETITKIVEALKGQIENVGWLPGQIAEVTPTGIKQLNDRSSLLPAAFSSIGDEEVLKKFARSPERNMKVRIKTPVPGKKKYAGVETRVYKVELIEPEIGVEVTLPESVLRLSDDEIQRSIPSVPVPDGIGTEDPQLEFLKSSNNAIVRSFKNTQGKGLAGVITNMTMDWNEANGSWDVERFSARAPQLVKIDLTFAVIHDIPPGLDADGFNRAPIWPVGDIMRGTFGDAYDDQGAGEENFNRLFARLKGGEG